MMELDTIENVPSRQIPGKDNLRPSKWIKQRSINAQTHSGIFAVLLTHGFKKLPEGFYLHNRSDCSMEPSTGGDHQGHAVCKCCSGHPRTAYTFGPIYKGIRQVQPDN
ncbi:hypothetical protein DPMN_008705 [Dreissena polymorpha]|uniref:Uncharacterized protein n=1 Tax=Dreissena polymorpha TaxID=45954 RepID=A0A9D4MZV1_DREPO|nr:hypothetical protein DPMN_008705 [Dreissena polymorpha]